MRLGSICTIQISAQHPIAEDNLDDLDPGLSHLWKRMNKFAGGGCISATDYNNRNKIHDLIILVVFQGVRY